ncbi:hypothetical protein HJC23_005549 [Cyclotella cryptica]|uniref:[Phosphatase 2A protein]-leucine-carboxy methyltransferase 1 n=1 Tax=Cyclotella cryptica TaxID=29204 RepID=A0ABD3PWS4_9STRA
MLSVVVFILGINMGAIVIMVILITRMSFALQNSLAAPKKEDPSSPHLGNSSTMPTANRSSNEGGSQTALLALWGRSQASKMKLPGATDNLAPVLMSKLSLFGRADDKEHFAFELGKYLSVVCSSLSVLGYFLTGAIFEDQVAYVATLGNTGLVTPMHCRTRWLDDVVERFIQDHVEGRKSCQTIKTEEVNALANVIILGSGYDTRAYRMTSLQSSRVCVYEIDAVGTSQEKRRVMDALLCGESGSAPSEQSAHGRMPTFVTCDFESQHWMERLIQNRFDASLPTLVVWEGVTMYLSLPVVTETLNVIAARGRSFNLESDGNKSIEESQSTNAQSSPDWYIAFDYLNPDWAGSQLWRFAMQFAREPIHSTFTKSAIDALVDTLGLDVMEHLCDGEEIQSKYSVVVNSTVTNEIEGIMGNYGGFVLARTRNAKDHIR